MFDTYKIVVSLKAIPDVYKHAQNILKIYIYIYINCGVRINTFKINNHCNSFL